MPRHSWVLALLLCGGAAAFGQTAETGMGVTLEHAVFFSGQVTMEDGSAPPSPVVIQKVCGGRVSAETVTNSKGGFSFKADAGGKDANVGDASQGAGEAPDVGKPMGISSRNSQPVTSALRDCEVQAVLAGFRADRVSIALKSTLDNTRLPVIVMHPVSRASSLTVSATTLAAPSNAHKAYDHGVANRDKQKWDAAAREFSKAVELYPAYAVAWYELGLANQKRGDAVGAVEAWKAALNADPKYVKPYENLAVLADSKGEWAESERYSGEWIALDPQDFPGAYLLNAVAKARLNRALEAERAAREGLRIDKDHKVPRLSYVLGLILLSTRKNAEAAKCFREYLEFAPNAHDAAAVRNEVSRLEGAAGAAR